MRIWFTALALLPAAAFAQGADAGVPAASPVMTVLPFIGVFFVFYFLLIKPQQKRLKEHNALLAALKKGDNVVTAGGIIGRISSIDGDKAKIEIAKDVEVLVLKSTVTGLVTAPVAMAADKKKKTGASAKTVSSKIANDN